MRAIFLLGILLILSPVHAGTGASVVRVFPSGEEIPENILRISVLFDQVPRADYSPRIEMKSSEGLEIRDVFDQEITWSPDRKLMTILLGPGRVKSGLVVHEKFGASLSQGQMVYFSIDIKVVKTWKVTGKNNNQLNPHLWNVGKISTGTRGILTVKFNRPLDASASDFLRVLDSMGKIIPGRSEMVKGESEWAFHPKPQWEAKENYRLWVSQDLEDSCGNSVGAPFEIKNGSRVKRDPLLLRIQTKN